MGQKPLQPIAQRQLKPLTLEPCYDCGVNHWIEYCPDIIDKKLLLPPLRHYCLNCGIKHFMQDWHANLEAQEKATLMFNEVLSPTSSSSS